MSPPRPAALFDVTHWIEWAGPYLASLVLLVASATGCVVLWRQRRVCTALADRACVEIVPTNTFDPVEGEIGRWARQLARMRYTAANIPACGAAARLRYSVIDGKMRCFLEGPSAATTLMVMPGFAEVEIRGARTQDSVGRCISPSLISSGGSSDCTR